MNSVEKALNVAYMYLDKDEHIVESTYGSLWLHLLGDNGQRKGMLLATNKRIGFYSAFLMKETFESFSYDRISCIEMKKGLFNGPSIIFQYDGNKEVMTGIEYGNVERFVNIVREKILL